jgi:hypothetical protein
VRPFLLIIGHNLSGEIMLEKGRGEMKSKRHFWPLLALFVLAPLTGEMLSGSAPPVEFFQPFGLIVLLALYGSGAILIREIVRRWHKGWPSVLLLGAAYGIYEEGMVVRSFFDPSWPDLGILAEYGRWIGVNWVWAVDLTIYHAVVSITMPIVLVELLFPAQSADPWLRRPGWILHTILFLSVLAFGPLVGMKAAIFMLWGCVIAIGALAWLAYRWPVLPSSAENRPARAGWFLLLGFAGMVAFLLVMWGLPNLRPPVAATLLAALIVPLAVWLIAAALGRGAWTDRQRWALAAGGLLPWIALAALQQADNANRPDNTAGMVFIGLAYLLLVIALGVSAWQRTRRQRVAAA